MERTQVERAIRAYARALNVADPLRLQFWDARGLTMAQLRLMFLLLERDGMTAGALAEAMRVRPATLTGLAGRLERQRLVERRSDPDDRRVVRMLLTDEGRRALREIEVASYAYFTSIFEEMGDERLGRFMDAMRDFAKVAEAQQERREFRP